MTRYHENPQTSVEIQIEATPDRIWQIITDPTLPAKFSDELIDAHWGEHVADSPGVGSTIKGHNQNEAFGEWRTTSIVITWEPERCFGWAVREVEDSASKWRFELEPTGTQTILRQHYLIGPGSSGVSRWIAANPADEEQIIADRLAHQSTCMMRTLTGVKEIAESS